MASEQFQELNEIAYDKKLSLQEQCRENAKQGVAEKNMHSEIQRNFDKAFGFNSFPYTHGDDVEREQASATKKWREELVTELENKGAIKVTVPSESQRKSVQTIQDADEELQEKARTMVEAKKNEHMLHL